MADGAGAGAVLAGVAGAVVAPEGCFLEMFHF